MLLIYLLVTDFLDLKQSTFSADVFFLQLLSSVHNRRPNSSVKQSMYFRHQQHKVMTRRNCTRATQTEIKHAAIAKYPTWYFNKIICINILCKEM